VKEGKREKKKGKKKGREKDGEASERVQPDFLLREKCRVREKEEK